ncbi:phage/plasmid primase, P4 family [Porticoccaceae bacterium]|nr:phage/plasmid primase, P4 family [Porticoccaceae bacterium]
MGIELTSGYGVLQSNINGELQTITIDKIIELTRNPYEVVKNTAHWFMASSLKSRSLKDQKNDGVFRIIWCDIDQDPPKLEKLCEILEQIIGDNDYIAFTTKSATKDNQKSRAIIPLAQALPYKEWLLAQRSLNDALEAYGIIADRCSERASQIAFLPNRGSYYNYHLKVNQRYFKPSSSEDLKLRSDKQTLKKDSLIPQTTEHKPLNLIDAFNNQHDVENILISAGYAQQDSTFRHPQSQSGSYSASVKNGRVHSLSTADPLYTGGGGIGAHNAFSAFSLLFHGGDLNKALFDAGENWVKIGGESWNTHRNIASLDTLDDIFITLAEDPQNRVALNKALDAINSADALTQIELRQRLKDLTGISIADIKAACKVKQDVQLSQMEIAEKFLLKPDNKNLLACEGALWQCSETEKIWKKISLKRVGQQIATDFKNQKLCRRGSDYKALSDLVYDRTEKESFFEDAPKGIATPTKFISICESKITQVTLNASHRARFQIGIEPSEQQPKILLQTLRDAFQPDEADEQIRQLRMFTGLAIFNLQQREQKALLLYGVGGSFKSGFQKIIEKLVRKEYLSSVSPLEWDQDYKKAELVGKLINLVPEINNDKVIPGAEFKSVVSCDRVSAREAYGKAFSFRPGCAHWFNSNFFLATRDQSDAFWRRWAVVYFSRSKPEKERDPNLAETIITTELPMILNWAIEGVIDYLKGGLFLSNIHAKCLENWKRESNSVKGWIADGECNGVSEEVQKHASITLVDAYKKYEFWCRDNNLKQVSSKLYRSRMEDIGYQVVIRDGYKRYKSLWSKPGL